MVGGARKKAARERPKVNGKGKEKEKLKLKTNGTGGAPKKGTGDEPKKGSATSQRKHNDDIINLVEDGDDEQEKSSEVEEDGDGEEGENDGKDANDDDADAEGSDNEALALPRKKKPKKESTHDLMLMFGPRKDVDFPDEDGKSNIENGAWCNICHDDPKVIQMKGRRAGFYKGGNSSLRRYIASFHYEEYSRRCKKAGIEENHQAVRDDIKEVREAAEKGAAGKKGGQRTLDGVVKKVQTLTAFCLSKLLHHVTQHVMCCDEVHHFHLFGSPAANLNLPSPSQPLALADTVTFRNILVTMRPKTVKSELPTYSTVWSHITNCFVDFMNQLKADIVRAPRDVNTMCDTWTAPHTLDPMFGLLVIWIDIQLDGMWVYRDEVTAFHKILGDHSGANLGRYLILFLDRCGVTSRKHSKLGHLTNDNASNNLTSVKEVGRRLVKRGAVTASEFDSRERNLSCFGHVIQLGIEDFMGEIMLKAAVATKQAIWDYDPEEEDNLINRGVDVIAVVRTLAVKPITSFVEHADAKFGPITTLRPKGAPARDIPWSAFKLKKPDWVQVKRAAEILEDANDYQQICSTTRSPTLHQVIPVLESLAMCWEAKARDPKYQVFHEALEKGLTKINKYYRKLDNTDVYILALLLHPYYKLDYIEMEWGGEAEYEADLAAGNPNPINWTTHA
ncbi:hypothetical protein V8D89_015500 [Ganoderma adspersum]